VLVIRAAVVEVEVSGAAGGMEEMSIRMVLAAAAAAAAFWAMVAMVVSQA